MRIRFNAAIAAIAAAAGTGAAPASQAVPATPVAQAAQQSPQPYVPPEQRIPSREPGAAGDALRAQVAQKLREQFEAADSDHSGTLTADEAQRGGLGYVAANFAAIDTARAGEVTFAEVQAWLNRRAVAAARKP